MKKIIAMVLCLLLLTGCTYGVPETTAPTEPEYIGNSPVPNLRTGIMAQGTTALCNGVEVTNQGVYFFAQMDMGQYLMYVDHDGTEAVKLCSRPDCAHDSNTCNAFFPSATNVCAYNGHLYIETGFGASVEITRRAVIQAANQAGARQTLLIEEPVAAAIGAGLDIDAPVGHLVVDVGGGTTDIAVISYGGAVVSKSIRVAGDKFDEAIITYLKNNYKILIGERTAEMIKIKVGSVYDDTGDVKAIEVKGRDLVTKLPKTAMFSSKETLSALMEPITAILDAICDVIDRTPPELIADIYRNGIVLTGGGCQLRGLDKLIERTTGIRTYIAKDPVSCVAIGTGKSLEKIPSNLGVLERFLKKEK